jgi:hypothetical protein
MRYPDNFLERVCREILFRQQAVECFDIAGVMLAMMDFQRFRGQDRLQILEVLGQGW